MNCIDLLLFQTIIHIFLVPLCYFQELDHWAMKLSIFVDLQKVISKINKKKGFIFAFCSVLCAVTAASLSRLVLINSDLNPLQTTEIRLLGSIIVLLPFVRNNLLNSMRKIPVKSKFSFLQATFLGTNIGILLQQNVFRLLPIGLGWTLLSASPVMALFFARAEGEEVNWKTIVLTVTTILGVGIAFI